MSKRRKPNSTNPTPSQQRLAASRLRTARRLHRQAIRQAELDPTHENLTRAFALGGTVKLLENLARQPDHDDDP